MAAGYLLDTNLISETRKVQANAGVMAFLAAADAGGLFLSVLTLGELRKGVEAKRRTDPVTADRLGAWVDSIETTFADRVFPVDVPAARLCGELSASRTLPVIDTLIAATAITRGLTLATRNTRDVAGTGIPTLDPWQQVDAPVSFRSPETVDRHFSGIRALRSPAMWVASSRVWIFGTSPS